MNQIQQTDGLVAALLSRAQEQVEERLDRSRRASKEITDEASMRLHQREEQELLLAQAKSERAYRQRVQAARIQLQREIDQLRWNLVQTTLQQLPARLDEFVKNEKAYMQLLQAWLAAAADAIESDELIVVLNARDRKRLADNWNDFVAAAGMRKAVTLSTNTEDDIGGLRVYSADRRICVDNTFKGRQARLEQTLHEVVTECLFATAGPTGKVPHG